MAQPVLLPSRQMHAGTGSQPLMARGHSKASIWSPQKHEAGAPTTLRPRPHPAISKVTFLYGDSTSGGLLRALTGGLLRRELQSLL